MRKLVIVLAAAVAFAGFASATSVASASTGTRSGSSSCSNLVKKYKKSSGAARAINPRDPNAFKKAITEAAKQLRSLASSGPRSLRSSFKRLAAFYEKISNFNPSDPAFAQQFSSFATDLRADLEKISRYFAKQCKATIG